MKCFAVCSPRLPIGAVLHYVSYLTLLRTSLSRVLSLCSTEYRFEVVLAVVLPVVVVVVVLVIVDAVVVVVIVLVVLMMKALVVVVMVVVLVVVVVILSVLVLVHYMTLLVSQNRACAHVSECESVSPRPPKTSENPPRTNGD